MIHPNFTVSPSLVHVSLVNQNPVDAEFADGNQSLFQGRVEMGWSFRAGACWSYRSALTWACLGLLALGELPGCSQGLVSSNTEGLEDLQPVSGSVSFEGKPTPGAIVMFFRADDPDAKGLRIAGEVDDEGIFEMSTTVSAGTLPGVQEGKYLVSITWAKPLNPDDRDSDMGPDLLPEKYKDHKTSNLQVEIGAGENALDPFELVP